MTLTAAETFTLSPAGRVRASGSPAGRVRASGTPGRIRAFGLAAVAATMLAALAGCETLSQEQKAPEVFTLPAIEPVAPGTLALAERALSDDRHEDADRLINRVLLSEPENWEARLLLAELYLASGKPQLAEPIFDSLVEKTGITARALQGLGISLTLQGNLDGGLDNLQRAVAEDPGLWRAWSALGYHYDSNQDWAAAANSYEKALEGNPNSAVVYNNRGFSRLTQKRLEEAVADFNRALRLDPEFDVARENLRLALAWQGKYVHAMAGAPILDLARILNNTGFIALMRGDYGNAEAYLLRAMEVDPRYNETAARNLRYLKQVQPDASRQDEQGVGATADIAGRGKAVDGQQDISHCTKASRGTEWRRSPRCLPGHRKGLTVTGHYERCQIQHPGSVGMERLDVGGQRVAFRVRTPPQMRQRRYTVGRRDESRDVLGCVARCLYEPYRARQLEAFSGPRRPDVSLVDRPVVVHPCVGKESDVDRVVGMVVADDHVGDRTGIHAQRIQRFENRGPFGHHAGVDDRNDGPMPNQ